MPTSIGSPVNVGMVKAPGFPDDASRWREGLPRGEVNLRVSISAYGYTRDLPQTGPSFLRSRSSDRPYREAWEQFDFTLTGKNPGELALSIKRNGKEIPGAFDAKTGKFSTVIGPQGFLYGRQVVIRGTNDSHFTLAAGGASGTLKEP